MLCRGMDNIGKWILAVTGPFWLYGAPKTKGEGMAILNYVSVEWFRRMVPKIEILHSSPVGYRIIGCIQLTITVHEI